MKWHQGERWQHLLQVYDEIAQEQFAQGQSRMVLTPFGDSQIHLRGDPSNPAIVFFHGVSSNSLMFGDWLIPKLSADFYTICIDTIGDMGRSCPRDGDPRNGPKDHREVAKWAISIFEQLDLLPAKDSNQKIHIVGYSLGVFIATSVARHHPEVVGKLVFLCPAGVVAPVRKLWLVQAITFAIVSSIIPREGSLSNALKHWFFGSMLADPKDMENLKYPELRKAIDAVGSPQVQFQPEVVDTDVLKEIVEKHKTLLVIGSQESVIDRFKRLKRRKQ